MLVSKNTSIGPTLILAAICGLCTWMMRVRTILEGFPVDFNEDVFEHKRLSNGLPLKTNYTGVMPVDSLLSMLVAAFIPGSAGLSRPFQLQQIYFLAQFSAVIFVNTVESHRSRNAGLAIRFVSVLGLLYQSLGAAVIMPIYLALFIQRSSGQTYLASGRQVPNAHLILPASILGYVIPTILMFFPWADIVTSQNFAAFWQAAPLYPNVLVYIFSLIETRPLSGSTDVRYLKQIYILSGVISTASHIALIYISATSSDPGMSLFNILIPREGMKMNDAAQGLLWIFQWDFLGTFASALVWCWLSVVQVGLVAGNRYHLPGAFAIGGLTLLGGPGAAFSAAWYWREEKMEGLGQAGRKKEA